MKKLIALLFVLVCTLSIVGCNTQKTVSNPEVVPEDFSFALTWGTYGISSYDSKTGKLVKTTDATHPEDYVTTCTLSDVQMKEIYALLHDLDISSYPATYDPINDPDSDLQIMSEPSMTLILTLRLNESEKTVACRDISMQFKGYNEKSQKFLDVCKTIKDVLTATEEWKALPEYEFLYD